MSAQALLPCDVNSCASAMTSATGTPHTVAHSSRVFSDDASRRIWRTDFTGIPFTVVSTRRSPTTASPASVSFGSNAVGVPPERTTNLSYRYGFPSGPRRGSVRLSLREPRRVRPGRFAGEGRRRLVRARKEPGVVAIVLEDPPDHRHRERGLRARGDRDPLPRVRDRLRHPRVDHGELEPTRREAGGGPQAPRP